MSAGSTALYGSQCGSNSSSGAKLLVSVVRLSSAWDMPSAVASRVL